MDVERLDVQTLADRACDAIERAILGGDLPPGAPLGEADLAARLGISRGPLREAISRLEGRRLLRRVPHAGVRVVALSDREVGEVLALREVLEGLAARLAATYMDAAGLDALEACCGFRHHPPGASGPWAAPEGDFHVRLAEGSGNTRLVAILCGEMYSLLRLHRLRSGATPERAAAGAEHREIVAALRARDGDLAESLTRAHVRRARDSLALSPGMPLPQERPRPRTRRAIASLTSA